MDWDPLFSAISSDKSFGALIGMGSAALISLRTAKTQKQEADTQRGFQQAEFNRQQALLEKEFNRQQDVLLRLERQKLREAERDGELKKLSAIVVKVNTGVADLMRSLNTQIQSSAMKADQSMENRSTVKNTAKAFQSVGDFFSYVSDLQKVAYCLKEDEMSECTTLEDKLTQFFLVLDFDLPKGKDAREAYLSRMDSNANVVSNKCDAFLGLLNNRLRDAALPDQTN